MATSFRHLKECSLMRKTWLDAVLNGENEYQTLFAYEVFKELGFFEEGELLSIALAVKNDLTNSKIYSYFTEN